MKNVSSVYLNGQFIAPEQATISVFDRGFIFGDAVYEVIPVYGKKPFRLPQHLQRLGINLRAVAINNPLSETAWSKMLCQLIAENDSDEQSLYIQISRGVAPRDHAFPEDHITPTVFAFSQPLKTPPMSLLEKGVNVITQQDIRWQRCDIKSTALLANVLLRQAAVEQDATEAILLRDGHITEGAASNVIIVDKDNVIATPPRNNLILPGVTRDLILELARQHQMPAKERSILESELATAKEIWLSSSTKEILPVCKVNDQIVGTGKPGPVFKEMLQHYQDYKQTFREGYVE
ncbi:MAG TPA: D-amino acid aminotransferase [Acidiferrobacteraceae bacterium]|jgi:D-alanine transaminase|nr:D-amino acid aminotransferase [Acidiferrobacteraceae bacterium]HEX19677.1 D-amino acid aminotransferase [Acidiferrobacteraceae bacterium]